MCAAIRLAAPMTVAGGQAKRYSFNRLKRRLKKEHNVAEIRKVGVIGAGQMGNGIAHACALSGYDVLLNDIDPARAEDALGLIEKNLARQVEKGSIDGASAEAARKRIAGAGFDALADCDLVIESAAENQAIKKEIFVALSKVLKKDAVMASNTSSTRVTLVNKSRAAGWANPSAITPSTNASRCCQ